VEDDSLVAEEEEEVTTTTTTTTEGPLENMAGPTRFYHENGKLPKFLMELKDGIRLTLKNEGRVMDTFLLDQPAKGGITASRINNADDAKDDLTVFINFKESNFVGQNGMRLLGVDFDMNFVRKGSEWRMTSMKIKPLVDRSYYLLDMGRRTVEGDAVYAPIGLCYSCSSSGRFRSLDTNTSSVSGEVYFPDWRMQVFEVRRGKFGPEWECGDMISIGLWVGILVTLGFALICAWGFSMLASINTMDRFDDPKGKTIHIPQTAD